MRFLGYTDDQMHTAGLDAYNYQGVGNPHVLAKIQPGESVLDLGNIEMFVYSFRFVCFTHNGHIYFCQVELFEFLIAVKIIVGFVM